jgi:hypothetical protein
MAGAHLRSPATRLPAERELATGPLDGAAAGRHAVMDLLVHQPSPASSAATPDATLKRCPAGLRRARAPSVTASSGIPSTRSASARAWMMLALPAANCR